MCMPLQVQAAKIVIGDADGNGTSDLLDAIAVTGYADGGEVANPSYCDINTNGIVDKTDAGYILKGVSGLKEYPISSISVDISLADNAIKANIGDTVLPDENVYLKTDNTKNTVTIISPGSYNFSGTLTDGQIIVDIPESYTNNNVEINLNGAAITNGSGPAIYGLNGDIEISAKKSTVNTLSDGTPTVFETETAEDGSVTTTDEPNACVFSHDGITLKGKGTLNINGNYANGICGKDEVVIKNLTLDVNAKNHAVKGKDSISVESGTVTLVSSEGDGIHCTKGNVDIAGGTVSANAYGEGIQAYTDINISAGEVSASSYDKAIMAETGNINISGGSVTAVAEPASSNSADTENFNYDGIFTKAGEISITNAKINIQTYCDAVQAAGTLNIGEGADITVLTDGVIQASSGSQGGFPGYGGNTGYAGNTTADISAKGLKSDTDILIDGGAVINITSSDDSIHANGNVTVKTSEISVSSGDDGVHADETLTFEDGCVLTVAKSYEGIEGTTININGGVLKVYADDDMVNASGGADGSSSGGFGNVSSGSGNININGGYLYCENTQNGDGIDSNGNITMNGGTVIVNGTTQNDNGAIDYDGTFAFNGGNIVAMGSAGMAQASTSNASGAYMLTYGVNGSGSQGGPGGMGGNRPGQGGQSGSTSSVAAGTPLTLADENGNVIMSFTPGIAAQAIVMGSGDIKSGTKYILSKNGTYSNTYDENGYAQGGTVTNGTSIASATVSSKVQSMS